MLLATEHPTAIRFRLGFAVLNKRRTHSTRTLQPLGEKMSYVPIYNENFGQLGADVAQLWPEREIEIGIIRSQACPAGDQIGDQTGDQIGRRACNRLMGAAAQSARLVVLGCHGNGCRYLNRTRLHQLPCLSPRHRTALRPLVVSEPHRRADCSGGNLPHRRTVPGGDGYPIKTQERRPLQHKPPQSAECAAGTASRTVFMTILVMTSVLIGRNRRAACK